jgi:hypothetical protein
VVVGGQQRVLGLKPTTEDPAIAEIGLAEATARLTDALGRLPELAHAQTLLPAPVLDAQTQGTLWYLALDELTDTGVDLRPSLTPEMDARPQIAAAPPPVHALRLDRLTVVDDADLFDRLGAEANLPRFLVPALKSMY